MARQLITHGKVTVSQKLVKSPSYIVPTGEEGMISLRDGEKGVSA
jgi:ribosomal protein S4